jgi:hypothetical protein
MSKVLGEGDNGGNLASEVNFLAGAFKEAYSNSRPPLEIIKFWALGFDEEVLVFCGVQG